MGKFEKQFVKLKCENRYFPNEINLSLFVCSKECSRGFISTTDYAHYCDKCHNRLKRLYTLNYKKEKKNYLYNNKNLLTKENKYKEVEEKEYIDDITYEDFKAGIVDCIGDTKEMWIALACCEKDCGNIELIVDDSTQVCPKCGKDMFRWKSKKYILNE
jgi:hypothetical protein